jgi:hypothetical protein
MSSVVTLQVTAAGLVGRRRAGRAMPTGEADVVATLAAVAGRLRAMGSRAVEDGDFDEVTRLVEAGQAVERALVALTAGAPKGTTPPSPPG